jgi:hypothetical protein
MQLLQYRLVVERNGNSLIAARKMLLGRRNPSKLSLVDSTGTVPISWKYDLAGCRHPDSATAVIRSSHPQDVNRNRSESAPYRGISVQFQALVPEMKRRKKVVRTYPEARNAKFAGTSVDGARRIRTADLLGAIQ